MSRDEVKRPKTRSWRDWADNLYAVLMLLAAAAAIVYQILEKTGSVKVTGQPVDVLLLLVALLTAGSGLQRLLNIQGIEDSISDVDARTLSIQEEARSAHKESLEFLRLIEKEETELATAVEGMSDADILIGKKQIEIAAINLIDSCSEHDTIKATGQYLSAGEAQAGSGLSEQYYSAIARKVSLASEDRGTMVYKVIVPSEPLELRELAVKKRFRAFEEANIPDRMKVRYSSFRWPIEILIAGQGMIIAFSGKDDLDYNVGIRITNAGFLEHMKDWYLENAWQNASEE